LSDLFSHADGSTPLTPDESEGLRLSWVLTRGDLDTAEQTGILTALTKAKWQRITVAGLLDDLVLRQLHRDMFGTVWTWAGRYRSSERNIGVAPEQVATGVRDLVADARLWLAADSPYEVHEAAVRFHHRLVAIHPFANGNGRHARAATDLILRASGAPPFTWGARDTHDITVVRSRYIRALRAADAGDITALMEFVIS
jgi:Fic-DOC domain mobile mystery protein B